MPELPEVETTRRGIAPHLEGQRVSRVIVRDRRLRWPIPEDLDVRLSGQRIVQVERRAKYLLINAEVGTLISHLGMSGNLRLVEVGLPAAKHEHVDIELESGLALRYTDPRRFGAMLWSLEPLKHELLARLGPEPLTDLFDGERLFQLSRGRSMAVKPFIMDNAVVVGVGIPGRVISSWRSRSSGSWPMPSSVAALPCATLSAATANPATSSRSCSSMVVAASIARSAAASCARFAWGSAPASIVRAARADPSGRQAL